MRSTRTFNPARFASKSEIVSIAAKCSVLWETQGTPPSRIFTSIFPTQARRSVPRVYLICFLRLKWKAKASDGNREAKGAPEKHTMEIPTEDEVVRFPSQP